jgi:integrase
MSKTSHLYRRGNTLYFRLSVPDRFRTILRVSEFTQSLRTQSRQVAIPAAYGLAGEAKKLFLYLDTLMTENDFIDEDLLSDIIQSLESEEAVTNNRLLKLNARRKSATAESASLKMAIKIENLEAENALLVIKHREESIARDNKVKADAFDKLSSLSIVGAPIIQQAPISVKVEDSKAPMLSFIYDEFIESHPKNYKKLGTFGNLFIKGCLGDKKIDLITQKEVNEFFKLLVRVAGGRGGNTDAYDKLNILERVADAEKNNDKLMAAATFKNTYVSSAKQFFKYLKLHYVDYAPAVSVEHIDYKELGGLRAKGENKQRALKNDKNDNEIKRLMDCQPMKDFSKNIKMSHKFWLPMIGLFTGARVNEICQLNPQSDVIKDEMSGIWYFNLTDDDAGVGVAKSHKNDHSKRKVPVHSKLIECGFLDYFNRVKALKHDRIFNEFKPQSKRASPLAEDFFTKYLRDVGLYDNVTTGKNVLGMHCLRGTFMSHTVKGLELSGYTRKQAMSKIQPIVGHCDGLTDENGKDLSVTAGYIDKDIIDSVSDNLGELKVVIEALDYAVVFPIANASI